MILLKRQKESNETSPHILVFKQLIGENLSSFCPRLKPLCLWSDDAHRAASASLTFSLSHQNFLHLSSGWVIILLLPLFLLSCCSSLLNPNEFIPIISHLSASSWCCCRNSQKHEKYLQKQKTVMKKNPTYSFIYSLRADSLFCFCGAIFTAKTQIKNHFLTNFWGLNYKSELIINQ